MKLTLCVMSMLFLSASAAFGNFTLFNPLNLTGLPFPPGYGSFNVSGLLQNTTSALNLTIPAFTFQPDPSTANTTFLAAVTDAVTGLTLNATSKAPNTTVNIAPITAFTSDIQFRANNLIASTGTPGLVIIFTPNAGNVSAVTFTLPTNFSGFPGTYAPNFTAPNFTAPSFNLTGAGELPVNITKTAGEWALFLVDAASHFFSRVNSTKNAFTNTTTYYLEQLPSAAYAIAYVTNNSTIPTAFNHTTFLAQGTVNRLKFQGGLAAALVTATANNITVAVNQTLTALNVTFPARSSASTFTSAASTTSNAPATTTYTRPSLPTNLFTPVSPVYDFSANSKIAVANLSFTFDVATLNRLNVDPANLRWGYYNELTYSFEIQLGDFVLSAGDSSILQTKQPYPAKAAVFAVDPAALAAAAATGTTYPTPSLTISAAGVYAPFMAMIAISAALLL